MKLIKATNSSTGQIRVFATVKDLYKEIGNPETHKEMVYGYIDNSRNYVYNNYWKLESIELPICETLEKKFNNQQKSS